MKENKSTIFKIVAVMILGCVALMCSSRLLEYEGSLSYRGIVVYIGPILILLIMAERLHMIKRILPKKTGWGMLLSGGWYIFVASALLAIFTFVFAGKISYQQNWLGRLLCFAGVCLMTACYEEIWFRGMIQGILEKAVKQEKRAQWRAIVFASGIFAITHLANLIQRPYLVAGTLVQVLYTFSLGLMLGVIFYSSKNIGVVIILHAIFNLLGSISEAVFKLPKQNTDISLVGAVLILILIMPGILWAKQMWKKI